MAVAIVIRAYNEEAHIGRLMTGIRHQTVRPDEVILVDSGSTDATVSIAEAFGAVTVHIDREEFSFGRALNRGIAATGAAFVVLASAHVYPILDDWLERLLDPLKDERIGLSFGRQTVPPNGRFSERRLLEQWFPLQSRTEHSSPFCNNANAAVRRELWVDQPYDETLTGLEDLAWAKQILARGSLLAYVAEAPVIHVHDESFNQVVNRYRREALAHKRIYPEQSLTSGTAFRLCAENIGRDLAAAGREQTLTAHFAEIVSFRVAQFYGTLKGFSQSGPVTEALKRRFYFPPSEVPPQSQEVPSGKVIDYEHALERT